MNFLLLVPIHPNFSDANLKTNFIGTRNKGITSIMESSEPFVRCPHCQQMVLNNSMSMKMHLSKCNANKAKISRIPPRRFNSRVNDMFPERVLSPLRQRAQAAMKVNQVVHEWNDPQEDFIGEMEEDGNEIAYEEVVISPAKEVQGQGVLGWFEIDEEDVVDLEEHQNEVHDNEQPEVGKPEHGVVAKAHATLHLEPIWIPIQDLLNVDRGMLKYFNKQLEFGMEYFGKDALDNASNPLEFFRKVSSTHAIFFFWSF